MGQALYRKYRSKSLDDIIGQEHITDTLRRAIKSGRVSHAYLFTGPRGVGKTSIARILAHELNAVAYTGEDNQLDIIEIDAASNGGVDEIRDLREKVYIAPSNGKFKVYIIDEVHMMTTSAFNALLKTLEEPPAHAIFILATTEAHKLPATIISRTQRFTFRPIAHDKMTAHLRTIAVTEKISIDDEALGLIAEHSDGSFRDAISMLDQASSSAKKISRENIESLLGIPPQAVTEQLVALIERSDTAGLAALLGQLKAEGYQAGAIAKQLSQYLRARLIAGNSSASSSAVLQFLAKLLDVSTSHSPDQLLELTLLEAALAAQPARPSAEPTPRPPAAAPEPPPAAAPARSPNPALAATDSDDPEPTSQAIIDLATWQALLEALKKQYNTLYGVIRMARPGFEPGKVTLTFGFAFHQKRASDPKNRKIVTATLEQITGEKLQLVCKFDKNAKPAPPPPASGPDKALDPALGAISAVFGSGEVLNT